MYRKRWKDPSVASSVAQCQTCSIVLPQNHIALLNGALSYTPFKGLRKTSPPYTLLLPSGTSAVQTRAGCEQRGRTERPRCSGLQPHAFHSDMKARSSPSSKATSREKKYREEKGGRVEKKNPQTRQTPKYGRTFSRVKSCTCLLGQEKHQSCFLIGGKRRRDACHKKACTDSQVYDTLPYIVIRSAPYGWGI